MNGCRDIRKDLSALVDGQLPPVRRADVEAHLVDCSPCRQRVSELRKLAEGVTGLPGTDPSPTFLGDVRRKIQDGEQTHAPVSWVDLLFRPVWLKVPLEAVAAIVVLVTMLTFTRPQRVEKLTEAPSRGTEAPRWDVSTPAISKVEPQGISARFSMVSPTPERAEESISKGLEQKMKFGLASSVFSGNDRDSAENARGQIELSQAPSETVIVEAMTVAEAQSQAEQAAAPLRGRLIVPPQVSRAQNFFIELPSANVLAFKNQLAVVRRQGLREGDSFSVMRSMGSAASDGGTAISFEDVEKLVGGTSKAEKGKQVKQDAEVVPVVKPGEPTTVLEIQVLPPRSTDR